MRINLWKIRGRKKTGRWTQMRPSARLTTAAIKCRLHIFKNAETFIFQIIKPTFELFGSKQPGKIHSLRTFS